VPSRAEKLKLLSLIAGNPKCKNIRNFFIHAENSFLFILLCPLLRILPYKEETTGDITDN